VALVVLIQQDLKKVFQALIQFFLHLLLLAVAVEWVVQILLKPRNQVVRVEVVVGILHRVHQVHQDKETLAVVVQALLVQIALPQEAVVVLVLLVVMELSPIQVMVAQD
jgi:hypothetical protein